MELKLNLLGRLDNSNPKDGEREREREREREKLLLKGERLLKKKGRNSLQQLLDSFWLSDIDQINKLDWLPQQLYFIPPLTENFDHLMHIKKAMDFFSNKFLPVHVFTTDLDFIRDPWINSPQN